jgi:hypothetical protein
MKVQAISLRPPKAAQAKNDPALTPELLAAVLAKLSRSNLDIATIISDINPEEEEGTNVARIFKFVDYGHASIGGLTSGIPIVLQGISLWLAYKIFDYAQQCDGQENSTRYIVLSDEFLPDYEALGFTPEDSKLLKDLQSEGLKIYEEEHKRLDALAVTNPEIIKYPPNANEKTKHRIRVNFGLDRARYFLPYSLKTTAAYIMTGRAWAEVGANLASCPQPEARLAAQKIREALEAYTPNLIRHLRPKPGAEADAREELETATECTRLYLTEGEQAKRMAFSLYGFKPTRSQTDQILEAKAALSPRENRYDRACRAARKLNVEGYWSHVPIAEARDLNRHRPGYRHHIQGHGGFYLPKEIPLAPHKEFYEKFKTTLAAFLEKDYIQEKGLLPYLLLLGSTSPYEINTRLDHFAYLAEIRTGPGAHFLYAELLREATLLLEATHPEITGAIKLGEAEPE